MGHLSHRRYCRRLHGRRCSSVLLLCGKFNVELFANLILRPLFKGEVGATYASGNPLTLGSKAKELGRRSLICEQI